MAKKRTNPNLIFIIEWSVLAQTIVDPPGEKPSPVSVERGFSKTPNMASRFISLLGTPFPTFLNHLRCPSFLHLRRLACGSRRFTAYSHPHISPLSPSQQQFHAQPINNNTPLDSSSSSSSFTSHPWPEWRSLITLLTGNDQLPPAVEDSDSFVTYEELSQDFLRAATLCLDFARERPNFIGFDLIS